MLKEESMNMLSTLHSQWDYSAQYSGPLGSLTESGLPASMRALLAQGLAVQND